MELIMKRIKGFTLVEVMIVVAVLAILASVAYPSYQSYVKQKIVWKLKVR